MKEDHEMRLVCTHEVVQLAWRSFMTLEDDSESRSLMRGIKPGYKGADFGYSK
jgi:hypothetical protein